MSDGHSNRSEAQILGLMIVASVIAFFAKTKIDERYGQGATERIIGRAVENYAVIEAANKTLG